VGKDWIENTEIFTALHHCCKFVEIANFNDKEAAKFLELYKLKAVPGHKAEY